MGKSETLNSISKGNWVEENVLTKNAFDDENLGIYESVIQNYSREKEDSNIGTNQADFLNIGTSQADFLDRSPKLSFPDLSYSCDILNSRKYYRQVQNWQGIVTHINEDSFKAKLYDLSAGGTNEVAEFDLEEVSPSDKSLLYIGSLFYWSVGRYMENGQSFSRSDIRFQRLITLDENDIENTKKSIEKKYSNLKERKIDISSTK